MPYGHIERNLVRAGGAGTQFAINHTIGAGATNYCCFLVQDVTAAGAVQALPRAYVRDADKAATIATMTDNTAAGALQLDAFVVCAYSGIDIGPVFNGPTRTVTLGSGMYTPNGHAVADDGIAEGNTIRAYRSLHRNVSFAVAGNATTDVVITHHLNTTNVVAFVSPSSDPCDSTSVGNLSKVFVQATTVDTTTLRCVRDDAGAFGGGAAAITFDVMILARVAAANANVALRTITMRPHLATAGANIGLPSDDYSGADVARAQAIPFTSADPAYEVLYTNVDGIAVAPGAAFTHNLGSVAKPPSNIMVLFGFSATPLTGIPYILNNATSTTTVTLAGAGAGVPVANAYVLFLRPFSVFQSEIVTN